MLKKLLKMNLALLLAGSSASIINTNNIIFAEEKPQDENTSILEQNEFIDDTVKEMPVANTSNEELTPLSSLTGLEAKPVKGDAGGFTINFLFNETQLNQELTKIEYIKFKLYDKNSGALLMERNLRPVGRVLSLKSLLVDIFQAPDVKTPVNLRATAQLIAFKEPSFNDTYSDSNVIESVFKDSYFSDTSKPYFEPEFYDIGIDKENRCFTFKIKESETSSVGFEEYEVVFYSLNSTGVLSQVGNATIAPSAIDKRFNVQIYGKNDLEKGLIDLHPLNVGNNYYVELYPTSSKFGYESIRRVFGKLGYYEGQVDNPAPFETGNSDNYSTYYDVNIEDMVLKLNSVTNGYKYAISKTNNDTNLEWETAFDNSVTFVGPESGQYYVYSKGVDTVGNKFDSFEVVSQGKIEVPKTPPSVEGLKAESTNGNEITLSWASLINNEDKIATAIEIKRDGSVIEQEYSVGETTYTDSGLEPGSTHKYAIKVINNEGRNGPVAEIEASTIAKPIIKKFELNEANVGENQLTFTWDVVSNDSENKAKIKLEVKINDGSDAYHELVSNDNQEGSYTFDGSTEDGKYLVKDLVFKLTAEGRGGTTDQMKDYIIKADSFSKNILSINEGPFNYTGTPIVLNPTIENVSKDWYEIHYFKLNNGQHERVNSSIINAGEYEVRAELTALGKKYYRNTEPAVKSFKVKKAQQTSTAIIEGYEGYDITVEGSNVYKLIQNSEVFDGAKVEYTSKSEDVVHVDENGAMTLLSPGEYEIESKIAETANYKEKLQLIKGTITAGKIDLVSTSFTIKVNNEFNLTKNILFKTTTGNEITKEMLLDANNSVKFVVKNNDLGVATGEATSIKPTKSGKLTVEVQVINNNNKALYNAFTQDVEINVEAISSGGSGGSSSYLFTGWKSNGSYYEKGKPANGIKEIKGVTYFFDEKGFPIKNQMIVIKEKTYITDSEGIFRKGKTEFEGATYVLDKTDGHMLKDWALVDGEWYFMNYETGKVHMNLWAPSASGDWYFMDEVGHMKKNEWIASSEGRWYYVGDEGKMVTNVSINGYWINGQGVYLSPTYKA